MTTDMMKVRSLVKRMGLKMNRGNVGASDHTQDEYFMKLALDASRGALPGCIRTLPSVAYS